MFHLVNRIQHPNRTDKSTNGLLAYQRNQLFHKRLTSYKIIFSIVDNNIKNVKRTVNEAPSGNARYRFRLDNNFSEFLSTSCSLTTFEDEFSSELKP